MRCPLTICPGTLLAAAGLFLGGCGYQAGFLIPADVHSVCVHMAGNETFWHEGEKTDNLTQTGLPQAEARQQVEDLSVTRPAYTMEVDLTERLKNEVVRRTPLKLAPESEADSVLTATIKKVSLLTLLRDVNDNVLSQRVTIAVDFTWRDRRSGRVLAEGRAVSRPTDFLTSRGETFSTAERTSFDFVAVQIVEHMQEGF